MKRRVNIFGPKSARVWVQLELDSRDLYVRAADYDEAFGLPCKWFQEEIRENGFDSMLNVNFSVGTPRFMQWALEHGIAPTQPVWLEVYPGEWTTPDYWHNESDCLYEDPEILEIAPWTPYQVERAWAYTRRRMERFEARGRLEREKGLKRILAAPHALYTRWQSYGFNPYDQYETSKRMTVELWSMFGRVPRSSATRLGETSATKEELALESDAARRVAVMPRFIEEMTREFPEFKREDIEKALRRRET